MGKKSNMGVLARLWAIPSGILSATGNSVAIVGNGLGKIGKKAVNTVDNVGKTITKKTDNAINRAISISRKSRTRHSRKSRRSTRRNRSTRSRK